MNTRSSTRSRWSGCSEMIRRTTGSVSTPPDSRCRDALSRVAPHCSSSSCETDFPGNVTMEKLFFASDRLAAGGSVSNTAIFGGPLRFLSDTKQPSLPVVVPSCADEAGDLPWPSGNDRSATNVEERSVKVQPVDEVDRSTISVSDLAQALADASAEVDVRSSLGPPDGSGRRAGCADIEMYRLAGGVSRHHEDIGQRYRDAVALLPRLRGHLARTTDARLVMQSQPHVFMCETSRRD